MKNPKDLALLAASALDGKKAQDILVLDVAHLTVVADYFVICSGRSAPQVQALAEAVEDRLAQQGAVPRRIEGASDARWIVMDYTSVIVHVFHEQERAYYNLERLWMDGSNRVDFEAMEEPAEQ